MKYDKVRVGEKVIGQIPVFRVLDTHFIKAPPCYIPPHPRVGVPSVYLPLLCVWVVWEKNFE